MYEEKFGQMSSEGRTDSGVDEEVDKRVTQVQELRDPRHYRVALRHPQLVHSLIRQHMCNQVCDQFGQVQHSVTHRQPYQEYRCSMHSTCKNK